MSDVPCCFQCCAMVGGSRNGFCTCCLGGITTRGSTMPTVLFLGELEGRVSDEVVAGTNGCGWKDVQ